MVPCGGECHKRHMCGCQMCMSYEVVSLFDVILILYIVQVEHKTNEQYGSGNNVRMVLSPGSPTANLGAFSNGE